jgi:hypothetical protein
MKSNTLLRILIVLLLGMVCAVPFEAQTLERQSISSTGTYFGSDGVGIRQTIGQPYNTTAYYGSVVSCRPGFQQPVSVIPGLLSDISLTVFPNPSADLVYIESPILLDQVTLCCFDITGKLVMRESIAQFKKYQIDCSFFPNAIYFVSVTTSDNKRFSTKLIINR